MYCQICGATAPTKQVTFMQNIGLVVVGLRSSTRGMLCRRCIDSQFWTKTLVTFFLGWWGLISLFVTPVFLIINVVQYLGALSLPRVPVQVGVGSGGGHGMGMGTPHFGPGAAMPIGGGPSAFGAGASFAASGPVTTGRSLAPRTLLIAGGIVAALMLVCCSGIALLALGGSYVSDRVAAAGAACDGRPVPGAAPYRLGDASAGIVAMQRSGGAWSPQFDVVPTTFHSADTTQEAALVLCMEPDSRESIETCAYSSGARVTRYRHQQRVRVVVAQTGAVLRDEVVQGPAPDACADEVSGSPVDIDGDEVGHDSLVPTISAALGIAAPASTIEKQP